MPSRPVDTRTAPGMNARNMGQVPVWERISAACVWDVMSMPEMPFEPISLHELELALRLAIAVVLGALIGWDRESKSRPAGLRTHMLTSLAAATFAVVALELTHWAVKNGAEADPVRAIEAVTAGVAFLAAGTIIQSRGEVVGLTTGAGMWLAGAIGVASGTGLYLIAVFVTILALIILMGLQRLSDRLSIAATPGDDRSIESAAAVPIAKSRRKMTAPRKPQRSN